VAIRTHGTTTLTCTQHWLQCCIGQQSVPLASIAVADIETPAGAAVRRRSTTSQAAASIGFATRPNATSASTSRRNASESGRRDARTDAGGGLVPLAQQDRSRWDHDAIAEGIALISATLPRGAVGPYQLQAAIAAVHDEATSAEDTDWPQIHALYGVLMRLSDNPVIALNRAVATAMVHGPRAGLAELDALAADARLAGHHRLDAVRAHLLERAGEREAAIACYLAAAGRTASEPERNYLATQAARLGESRARPGATPMSIPTPPVRRHR